MLLKNSNTTNDEDNNAYQELVLEITNEIIDIVVCVIVDDMYLIDALLNKLCISYIYIYICLLMMIFLQEKKYNIVKRNIISSSQTVLVDTENTDNSEVNNNSNTLVVNEAHWSLVNDIFDLLVYITHKYISDSIIIM